jgi:hypothetical protein
MSRSRINSLRDMLDVKIRPEIYPMTSMQETFEYFHDKLNQVTESIERLVDRVQELSTRTDKTAATVEATKVEELSVDSHEPVEEPAAAPVQVEVEVESEQDVSPCLWDRVVAKLESEQELESEEEEQAETEPLHFRRFSEQQLDPGTPPVTNGADRAQPAKTPRGGLKRLSLCMMPPDEMNDILAAISPDVAAYQETPGGPAPSPAIGADSAVPSAFLQ